MAESSRIDYEVCQHCGGIVRRSDEPDPSACPTCGAKDWKLNGTRVGDARNKPHKPDATEPIEVEAEIIEAEISPLASAERWLAGASERVAERRELYRPPKAIANDTQRKDAMAARAQVRKDVAEIDAERKAMLRSVEDGLKRFKASVKDVFSPLTDLDAEYKELLDAYEAQWKADRELELAQEYEAIAPDLVPLVPFRTILARYGQQRGKVWTNRSTNVEAAKDMLADAVEDIAGGERTVDELVDDEDREAIKARYFQTLDLQATLAEARRAKEQRERVRQLEDDIHELRMQQRITALTRYDGQGPEQVMRGLLESGTDSRRI